MTNKDCNIIIQKLRYYFQFGKSNPSENQSTTNTTDLSVTPKPLLPEIEPPAVAIKVKRQVVHDTTPSDYRLALDKARFDVQKVRKLEYSKDDKLWSVIKKSPGTSNMLVSKSTSALPSLSYSANQLKERSRIITEKAIHSPGVLLSGVRSTKDDLKYEVRAPKFNARALSRVEKRYEAVHNSDDDCDGSSDIQSKDKAKVSVS